MQKTKQNKSQFCCQLTDAYKKVDYANLRKKVHREKEQERLSGIGATAQTVKYADLYENILWMIKFERAKTLKYLQRKNELISQLNTGDPVLRQADLDLINEVKNFNI